MIFIVFGWVGTMAFLISYLLLSLGKIKSTQKIYQILNLVGAIGLVFNAIHLNDYPNVVVNITWFIIGAIGLLRIIRK